MNNPIISPITTPMIVPAASIFFAGRHFKLQRQHFTGPEDFNFMAGLSCATRCGPVVRTEVRRCALELVDGSAVLIETTTSIDQVASYETLLLALSAYAKVFILSWQTFPSFSGIPLADINLMFDWISQ